LFFPVADVSFFFFSLPLSLGEATTEKNHPFTSSFRHRPTRLPPFPFMQSLRPVSKRELFFSFQKPSLKLVLKRAWKIFFFPSFPGVEVRPTARPPSAFPTVKVPWNILNGPAPHCFFFSWQFPPHILCPESPPFFPRRLVHRFFPLL